MFPEITGRVAVSVLLACLTWNTCAAADAPTPGTDFLVRADPPVPRPSSRPCSVELVRMTTNGVGRGNFYSSQSCGKGPWAKVVLEMDFVLTDDQEEQGLALPLNLWLSGVNLYSGNVALAGNHVQMQPCFELYCGHTERDVTDYLPVLAYRDGAPALEGNWVIGTEQEAYVPAPYFAGIATLKFYPATVAEPAPAVPDAVFPLGAGNYRDGNYYATGALADLRGTSDRLAASFNVFRQQTLPRNIERAYLDVIVRPSTYHYVPATGSTQGHVVPHDAWYSCLPAPLAVVFPRLLLDAQHSFAAHCIGGAFREAEVSIDQQPAGVVPLYPAYPSLDEGDAALWRPASQPQELLNVPHRIDLSPFAALLSNGAPHTVSVRIASNSVPGLTNNPLAGAWASATLLVYQDRRVKQVTGMLTRNDLAGQPAVQIGDVIKGTPADQAGIKPGNIIVKMNGQPLERGDEPDEAALILMKNVKRMKVGSKVTFSVVTEKDKPATDVTVTLAERPKPENQAQRFYAEDLGFTAREIVFEDTYRRKLPADQKGVVVALVKRSSAAMAGKLEQGDLITKLNQTPVTDVEQFKKEYQEFRKAKPKEAVVLEAIRNGNDEIIRIEPPQ